MSVKIMGLVWDMDLPQEEKFVLLAFADHADHEGKRVYPGIDLIARKTGYSKRSVQRIVAKLKERGILIPVAYESGGRSNPTVYIIPIKDDKIAPFVMTKDDAANTLITERVTSTTLKGDIAMSPESLINHQESKDAPQSGARSIPEKKGDIIDGMIHYAQLNQGKVDVDFLAEHLRPLGLAFIAAAGADYQPVKSMRGLWHKTLGEWYELKLQPSHIREAVEKMRADELTIKGPQSVTGSALSLKAAGSTQSTVRNLTEERLRGQT